MIHEFEILALYEDLVPSRLQRFFQTEELCCCRKIQRTAAVISHDADLILTITNQLARNRKFARRAERVLSRDLFCSDRSSIHQQLVTNNRLNFAADAQVVVECQHNDRCVARITPLRAASILYEPICHRLDQLVPRIDSEQSTKGERRCFDAAIRPAPVNSILAPVRSSDHRW